MAVNGAESSAILLAEMGRSLALLSDEGVNLILAGALISITVNPALFGLITPLMARFAPDRAPGA